MLACHCLGICAIVTTTPNSGGGLVTRAIIIGVKLTEISASAFGRWGQTTVEII